MRHAVKFLIALGIVLLSDWIAWLGFLGFVISVVLLAGFALACSVYGIMQVFKAYDLM